MTTTPSEARVLTTEEEFHDQLRQLIETAERNDIDVSGGWVCLSETDDQTDWDVEIIELITE